MHGDPREAIVAVLPDASHQRVVHRRMKNGQHTRGPERVEALLDNQVERVLGPAPGDRLTRLRRSIGQHGRTEIGIGRDRTLRRGRVRKPQSPFRDRGMTWWRGCLGAGERNRNAG